MNTNKLLVTAFTELAYAFLAHCPGLSPIQVILEKITAEVDGRQTEARTLPEGLWLLVERLHEKDDSQVQHAMLAALQVTFDSRLTLSHIQGLIALAAMPKAVKEAQTRGLTITIADGDTRFADDKPYVELGEKGWTTDKGHWASLQDALAQNPEVMRPPQTRGSPESGIFLVEGETGEKCRLRDTLIDRLELLSDGQLLDSKTVQHLKVHLPHATPQQLATLVRLFAEFGSTPDHAVVVQLQLALTIALDGAVRVELEDLIPPRVFTATGTLQEGKLAWEVFDQKSPQERVQCESLDEVVDGLLRLALGEEGEKST